jgi:hypothetical protein
MATNITAPLTAARATIKIRQALGTVGLDDIYSVRSQLIDNGRCMHTTVSLYEHNDAEAVAAVCECVPGVGSVARFVEAGFLSVAWPMDVPV